MKSTLYVRIWAEIAILHNWYIQLLNRYFRKAWCSYVTILLSFFSLSGIFSNHTDNVQRYSKILQLIQLSHLLFIYDNFFFFFICLFAPFLCLVGCQGNYMAATEEQLAKMEKGEYSKKLQVAYDKLTQAGAHYVIDSINDLPGVIEDINRRLACGEKP